MASRAPQGCPEQRVHVDEVAPSSYLPVMRSVGIKVLKNKLSEYVRAAATGETVLVTDRDRVVAELVPPRRAAVSDEDILAVGAREGWLTRATNPYTEPLPEDGPAPDDEPPVSFVDLMADLARDREDR